MTYPLKEKRNAKKLMRQNLDSKLLTLFNKSKNWADFCLKASIEHGVNVNSLLSKWKIAYMILNYGKTPFMILSVIFGILFPYALIKISAIYGLVQKEPTALGVLCVLVGLGSIAPVVVSACNIFSFAEKLERSGDVY